MPVGKMIFVNGGERRLREAAGVWLGNHYTVLLKDAHVPALTDTTIAVLTNFCDSANYAPEDIAGKAFNGANADMSSIDHTNAGVDTMNCRWMYFVEGLAAGQSGPDIVIAYVDLVGSAANGDIGGPIDIDTQGAISYTET